MGFREAARLFERYVDWERRLAREVPFLEACLRRVGARDVADVACGSGGHAAALASAGYRVAGFEPDGGLLHRAAARARKCGVQLTLHQAAFADLPAGRAGVFDAALCLGNSLSLVPPGPALARTFLGLASLLKAGGLLVAHTLNYSALAARDRDPWGPVRTLPDGTLLLKGFLPRASGPWDVLFIALASGGEDGEPVLEPVRFPVHPHGTETIQATAAAAGLAMESLHGGFRGEPPEDPRSADRIYLFVKKG